MLSSVSMMSAAALISVRISPPAADAAASGAMAGASGGIRARPPLITAKAPSAVPAAPITSPRMWVIPRPNSMPVCTPAIAPDHESRLALEA